MAADTEGCLGELRAGTLVPHVVCTKIWLLPRSPENRRGCGSTLRGEDAPKPANPKLSQSQPCHWQSDTGKGLVGLQS